MNIKIVTDSTSDLRPEVAAEHGIEVIPLKVIFGEETFRDGVDIQLNGFYDKLNQSGVFPKTSQPSPAEFLEVYTRLLADSDSHVISIHISEKMSGTANSAQIAKAELTPEQAARLTIIDSTFTCYGLAIFAIEMAKMAATGASAEQCIERFQSLRSSIHLYFLVDSLEFLQRGGRIGKASAFLGSLLNIKPILTIDAEGVVAPVDKVRGQRNAIKKMLELCLRDVQDKPVHVTLLHSMALETAESIATEIRAQFRTLSVHFENIGPVISTHVGPGAVAVILHP